MGPQARNVVVRVTVFHTRGLASLPRSGYLNTLCCRSRVKVRIIRVFDSEDQSPAQAQLSLRVISVTVLMPFGLLG